MDLLQNSLPLSIHILFVFLFEWNSIKLSKISWKALTITVTPFSSFEGTQEYLLKRLMTHNKNLTSLSKLLINCMLAQSAPQILSLNKN